MEETRSKSVTTLSGKKSNDDEIAKAVEEGFRRGWEAGFKEGSETVLNEMRSRLATIKTKP